MAIDGNYTVEECVSKVSHTRNELNAWWSGTLETAAKISKVRIVGRTYALHINQLKGFKITLDEGKVCAEHMSRTEAVEYNFFPCVGVSKSVKILSFGNRSYLSLCEVSVYGQPINATMLEDDILVVIETCNRTSDNVFRDLMSRVSFEFLHSTSTWTNAMRPHVDFLKDGEGFVYLNYNEPNYDFQQMRVNFSTKKTSVSDKSTFEICGMHVIVPRRDLHFQVSDALDVTRKLKNNSTADYILTKVTNHECYNKSKDARISYTGQLAVTASGQRCERWDKTSPKTNLLSWVIRYQHNYCRSNANATVQPWCFTDSDWKTWGYCDVPKCKSDKDAVPPVVKQIKFQSCNQSSHFYPEYFSCEMAIDGNYSVEECVSKVSHTRNELNAWWSGTLETAAKISKVRIVGRTYALHINQLKGFKIILDEGKVCAEHMSRTEAVEYNFFPCVGVSKSVKILSFGNSSYLSLCEVSVYGQPINATNS